MSLLELLIRFLITILVLLVMARLNGPKLISQMNFYDYVIGITIGSLAASATIDSNLNIFDGLLAIILYLLSGMLMSWLARSNMTLRRFFTGKPIVIIAKGNIQWNGLKRARMNMNELLTNLRYSGYFDIADIDYAILEPTGKLSIQAKSNARQPRIADLNIVTSAQSILANVIIDGTILHNNLKEFGKNEAWLRLELDNQKIDNLKKIALATLNEQGNLTIYLKDQKQTNHSSFI